MANPWQVGVVCFSVNGQSMASGHSGVFQTGMVVGFYLRWFDSLRDGCKSFQCVILSVSICSCMVNLVL